MHLKIHSLCGTLFQNLPQGVYGFQSPFMPSKKSVTFWFVCFIDSISTNCWLSRSLNNSDQGAYVTWPRGMSRMSGILILSYRLKEVINSYVLHCFWIERIFHISATRCPIEVEFGSKCSILNGQVIYIKKAKLIIADRRLIPLDRVTYYQIRYMEINLNESVLQTPYQPIVGIVGRSLKDSDQGKHIFKWGIMEINFRPYLLRSASAIAHYHTLKMLLWSAIFSTTRSCKIIHNRDFAVFVFERTNETSASTLYAQVFSLAKTLQGSGT